MLTSFLRDLGRGLVQIFYPNLCWVCGQSLSLEQQAFCDSCRACVCDDPHSACPFCAATIGPFADTKNGCLSCRGEHFAFERAIRLGPYRGALRDVILRLKHAHAEGLAELAGETWAERARADLQALGAHCVVPVPLHWWRRWQRGYNQSEALARGLARMLGVPLHGRGLRRIRATLKQSGLKTASDKRNNVRGAFQAGRWLRCAGQTVLLVDDVLTTGSTAHEAARALRRAGARRVVVAVLARAEG